MRLINIDPRESVVQTNDVVLLSEGGPEWRVTKTRGTVIYVESILGKRTGHTSINEVVLIKRDVHYELEPDWTTLYGEGTSDL